MIHKTLPFVSQPSTALHLQCAFVLLQPPRVPFQCGPATSEGPPGLRCNDWRPPGPAPASGAHPGCSDLAQSNGYGECPSSPVPAGLPPLKQGSCPHDIKCSYSQIIKSFKLNECYLKVLPSDHALIFVFPQDQQI